MLSDDNEEGEPWTPEEEARLLGLLDDATKASIGTMFMGRESGGAVTMDALTEIMTELQVAYDPAMLAKVMVDQNWERIDNDRALLLIAFCIDAAQKQVAEQAKAESAVVVSQAAQPVVYLNTLQYIWHLTPCSSKEEGVEYRWNRITVDIRPKTILMVSVAIMMLIAATLLIVAIIGLNERSTRDTAEEALTHFATTIDVATDVLLDESIKTIVATSLRSTSDAVSTLSNGMLAAHQDVVETQLRVALAEAQSTLEVYGTNAMDGMASILKTRVSTVEALFADEGTSEAMVSFGRQWITDGLLVFIASAQAPLLLPSLCDGYSTVPGFLQLSWATPEGSMDGCGTQLQYACSSITRIGLKFCVAETETSRTSRLTTEYDNLVTEMNLLRPTHSIELEVAVEDAENATIPIGGRKELPILCVRHHACDQGNDIFYLAKNSTNIGSGFVNGYNTAVWLSSYDKINVQGREIMVGMKEDVAEGKERLFESLGTGTAVNLNMSISPFVVFAISDYLERVELLPYNESRVTTVRDEYLGYALNGRQGISFATVSDPTSLMAGYSSALSGDLAVGIEYTARQISFAATDFLISTFQSLQSGLPADWDLVVARQDSTGAISYPLPLRGSCASDSSCPAHEGVLRAFEWKSSGYFGGRDSGGDSFEGWYRYVDQTPPLVVIAQYSHSQLNREVLRQRYEAIGVGLGVSVAVQLMILLLTRRVLDRIERDYNKYKRQIEEEKHQFSELVKDVMPPYIAERIMKGTRLIAETHPQLTFFFSDIVGSTEQSKSLTNKQLVRMLGYSFMLEDEIASYFGVHKIKTIGDAYFAVSGLEDSQSGGAQLGKDHQVYRMVSFACICQQLFGPAYDHFPERTECFKISAGETEMGHMKMVRLRMGLHTGPAVAGVVDVGRAPHFDCFGPSVNLASRMEGTSSPGRVQLSGPTQEILAKADREGLFEYEPPRKTLVKGYGTMVTYLVKSTNLPVPEELIDKLHIERANQRQYFSGQMEARREEKKKSREGSDQAGSEHKSDHQEQPREDDRSYPTLPNEVPSPSHDKRKGHSPRTSPGEKERTGTTPQAEPLPSLVDIVTLPAAPGVAAPGTGARGAQRHGNGERSPAPVSGSPPMVPSPSAPRANGEQAPAAPMAPLPAFTLAMPPPPPPPDI